MGLNHWGRAANRGDGGQGRAVTQSPGGAAHGPGGAGHGPGGAAHGPGGTHLQGSPWWGWAGQGKVSRAG